MKRILVIGLSSNLGGAECFIMNYFRNIDKTKISMDFLIYEEHCVFEDEIIRSGCTIYRIVEPRYKRICGFIRDRNELFKKLAQIYDTIWLNDCSLANACDLMAAKRYGFKKRIFHSHNNRHMRNDKKKKFYEIVHNLNKIFIDKWATDFWACSYEAGKFCFPKKILEGKHFRIIPNAIEMDKYYYDPCIREEYRNKYEVDKKIVIGNVGRLHFQKNQTFLIDIFGAFVKMHTNAELWIIGDGDDRKQLEEKVHKLGIDSKVKFMGIRNDISHLMQAMDVFIFPSVFEGLGIVLIEAQTAGLKVFASKKVIPASVKITESLTFVPLENSAMEWAKIVEDALDGCGRRNLKNELEHNEFNIKWAAKELENLLG